MNMRSRATALSILFVLTSLAAQPSALAKGRAEARTPAAAEKKAAEKKEASEKSEVPPSPEVTRVTNWVISSRDNGDYPFIVIDKVAAEVFVFDPDGRFIGKSAALLGATAGDESSPGVGDRELSDIPVEERTTPAGRFVAKFGWARGRERVLWVDYATAISLHPVVTGNAKQQRLKRLKSSTPEDNRITFGCINVPKPFYAKVVRPLLKDTAGIVYILPDTKPIKEVFLAMQG